MYQNKICLRKNWFTVEIVKVNRVPFIKRWFADLPTVYRVLATTNMYQYMSCLQFLGNDFFQGTKLLIICPTEIHFLELSHLLQWWDNWKVVRAWRFWIISRYPPQKKTDKSWIEPRPFFAEKLALFRIWIRKKQSHQKSPATSNLTLDWHEEAQFS